MRSILLLGVIGLFMITVLSSCGTNNENLLPGANHETAGLALDVMPGTFFGGAEVADLSLNVEDLGDSLMVEIVATGATNLKALYFKLDYDKTSLRPMTVNNTGLMGDQDDLISLQILKEMGVVHYGQVLTHPDLRVGFDGSGVLAKVLFKKEPALNTRVVSIAPDSAASAQIVDEDLSTNLSWWYANQGDYDQNSEVNLADLTMIAIHFQAAGPWPIDDERILVDGDSNGEINGADISIIAMHYQKTAAHFQIFSSGLPASNYPDGGTRVNILGEPSALVIGDGVRDPGMRRLFSVPIADIDGFNPANGYWVFPSDGDILGIESNDVGWEGIPRPVITLTNPSGAGTGVDALNAYESDILTGYVFNVIDPVEGDVTLDPLTVYTVTNGAGTILNTDATLDIDDAFEGVFTVSAAYNGGLDSNDIYMSISVVPPDGLFIMPDTGDADWAGRPGDGVDASSAYELGEIGGFNDDYSVEFSMVANTQADGLGDVIPNADLDWFAFPPFIVDWTGDGTFEANMFTGEYIFAQDTDTNNSNDVYVVHLSLPTT